MSLFMSGTEVQHWSSTSRGVREEVREGNTREIERKRNRERKMKLDIFFQTWVKFKGRNSSFFRPFTSKWWQDDLNRTLYFKWYFSIVQKVVEGKRTKKSDRERKGGELFEKWHFSLFFFPSPLSCRVFSDYFCVELRERESEHFYSDKKGKRKRKGERKRVRLSFFD